MATTRRQFLVGLGAAGLGLSGAGLGLGSAGAQPMRSRLLSLGASGLPDPSSSGIDHIVVCCMENRSFDHFLGWLPGANGKQAGLSYPDSAGALHPTYHLSTYQGCGHPDPDHSYAGARVEYDNGACDGWLRVNDAFSIGYYQQSDLAFLGNAAPAWTACDNYFAATLGPTFPNRLYLHAAQTDRIDNTFNLTSIPTIWDSLAAAGVSHAYYFNDLPFVGLWGTKYVGISRPWASFLADAALGALPAVSYVEPPLGQEAIDGIGRDDHPHADIRNGEDFMNSVYRAITTSPNWSRTALVFTYDEWGGFYDHVAPTTAPDTNPALTGLRGFRVPCLVISPRSSRGTVAHGLYDHTSILKMIEWRWGLSPLTPRDSAANNLAEVLDFTKPANTAAPQWDVHPVLALPCTLTGTQPLGAMAPPLSATTLGGVPRSAAMQGLRNHALANGFHVAAFAGFAG